MASSRWAARDRWSTRSGRRPSCELAVDLLGPHLADGLDFDPRRRQAEGKALGVGQLDFAFLGQRAGGYLAGGGQQVGVPVALVAFPIGGMQRHVHRAAILRGQAAGEPHRQLPPFRLAQLVRQGDFPLAGGAGVLALLGFLGGVPQLGPAPLAGAFGQDELGVEDAAAPRVIVLEPLPLVDQAVAGAVGGGGDRTPAGGAGERLGRAVVDGHYAALLFPAAQAALRLPFAAANGPRRKARLEQGRRDGSPRARDLRE